MSLVGLAVVGLFTLASFWLAFTQPLRALALMVFLVPWMSLSIDFGITLYANQIVLLALCVATFMHSLVPGWRGNRVAGLGFLLAFVAFGVMVSLLRLPGLPSVQLNEGGLRGPMPRAISQIVLFLFALSPLVLIPLLVRSQRDLGRLLRAVIASAVLLAVIGWMQLAVWVATGVNPLPIGIVNTLLGGVNAGVREGIVGFSELRIYRMNSLAAEPRSLGCTLALAMMMIQALAATSGQQFGNRRLGGRMLVIWLFLLLSMLATLSTSAIALWLLGSVAQVVVSPLFGVRLRVSRTGVTVALVAVVLPLLLAIAAAQASGFQILDLIAARTIDRIDAGGGVEDFDLAITDYLKDHPQDAIAGLGVGNAHLFAQPYIDPEFQYYALGGVFVAKTQFLRLISETGFIGLLLFLLWYLVLLVDTSIAVRRDAGRAYVASIPIGVMAVIVLMANSGLMAQFIVVAGCLAAVCRLAYASGSASPQRRMHWVAA